MSLTTRVTNDYLNWSIGATWVRYDSNNKVSITSPNSDTYYDEDCSRDFTLTNPAHEAVLTFSAKHFRETQPYGLLTCEIILERPSPLSDVTLYSNGTQKSAFTNVVNALDIASYLTASGTYTLKIRGIVQSEFVDPVWKNNEVHGSTVLLQVDDTKPSKITNLLLSPGSTHQISCSWDADAESASYNVYYKKTSDSTWSGVNVSSTYALLGSLTSGQMYDIKVCGYNASGEGTASNTGQMRPLGTITQNLSDASGLTENFVANRIVERVLEESTGPTETFNVQRFTTTPTSSIILLCGYTGSKIYTFESGLVAGYFDTPEMNFGYPDKEKILTEIRFGSESDNVHTLLVYVSVNSGTTWTLIGSDTCGLGKTGFVYPWLTSNKFLIRFSGAGLHLYFYEVYAVPSGWKVRTA
jgi:hypothetical protein